MTSPEPFWEEERIPCFVWEEPPYRARVEYESEGRWTYTVFHAYRLGLSETRRYDVVASGWKAFEDDAKAAALKALTFHRNYTKGS